MSLTSVQIDHDLYHRDLVLWYEETVARLQQGDFQHLDMENLIEEIVSLANRERRELKNRLFILLSHYLKRLYIVSTADYRGWENTIREQQRQIRQILQDSPSLKNYAYESFNEIWSDAIEEIKANYPDAELPWAWTQTIDELVAPELLLKLRDSRPQNHQLL
jgi:hypothetical protein